MGRPKQVRRCRTKQADAIWAAVKAAGGRIEMNGSGHLKVTGPGGIAVVAQHYGNGGSHVKQAVRTIRKYAGLDISPHL